MNNKLKKTLKISLILISAITLFMLIISINYYLEDEKLLFYSTGTKHKAFLHSTWEMSEKEVERANNTFLFIPDYDFFDFPDSQYPKVLNMSRYKSRVQREITIWGYDSRVEYSFFDDRLFEYTLFVKGYDAKQLHEEILKNLSVKYGEGTNESKDDNFLYKMSWDTKLVTIDHWLVKESSSNSSNPFLSLGYLAGIRFGYKPMFKQIHDISLKEHEELF